MKKILTFLFLIFLCNIINAQTPMRDVLYLKNGSIIKGTIIEQSPPVQLKIQTADGSLFVYKYDEILKIEREEAPQVINGNTEKKELPEMTSTEYNYKLGWGISIGLAGGVFGIPIRYNLNKNIAFEAAVYARPEYYSFTRLDTDYYNPNTPIGPVVSTHYETDERYKIQPMIMCGFDFFLGEHYNKWKGIDGKLIRNGILIKGGTSFGKPYNTKMVVLGWAHETFKRNRPKNSYLFEMGIALVNSTPPFYNDNLDFTFKTIPSLYLKIHWNQKLF